MNTRHSNVSVRALRRGSIAASRVTAVTHTTPSYRSSSAASQAALDTTTVTLPTVVTGDMLLATFTTIGGTHTTPSGWNLVVSTVGNGTYPIRQSVYSRVGLTADTSTTVNFVVSAAQHATVTVGVYSGVDSIDVTAASGSPADQTTGAVAPAVTTTTDHDLVVGLFSIMGVVGDPTMTSPATERIKRVQGWIESSIADQGQAAAGSSGTRTATTAGASVIWAATTVALKGLAA